MARSSAARGMVVACNCYGGCLQLLRNEPNRLEYPPPQDLGLDFSNENENTIQMVTKSLSQNNETSKVEIPSLEGTGD
jgi:hypothetical protein